MKRKIAMILLTAMTLSLTACGGQEDTNQGSQSSANVEATAEPTEAPATNQITSALELVNTVWAKVPDDNKFPVGGGDSENLSFEGPAVFNVAKTDELDITLGFPAAQADKIDDAASMMNAMMANNFTAGIYRVTDAANVQTVADALKENIMAREWMCGMPEKLMVISVDNYVISVFGINDFIEPFKTAVTESYENVTVLYEEAFVF